MNPVEYQIQKIKVLYPDTPYSWNQTDKEIWHIEGQRSALDTLQVWLKDTNTTMITPDVMNAYKEKVLSELVESGDFSTGMSKYTPDTHSMETIMFLEGGLYFIDVVTQSLRNGAFND